MLGIGRLTRSLIRCRKLSVGLDEFGTMLQIWDNCSPGILLGAESSLTEIEFETIVTRLKKLGAKNQRILFVVGTISYRGPAGSDGMIPVYNVAPIIYHSYDIAGHDQPVQFVHYTEK